MNVIVKPYKVGSSLSIQLPSSKNGEVIINIKCRAKSFVEKNYIESLGMDILYSNQDYKASK